jgi:FkbH-like protein
MTQSDLTLPLDFLDLMVSKRKLLKRTARTECVATASVRFVGGYEQTDTCDWIRIFSGQQCVDCEAETSEWGPAFANCARLDPAAENAGTFIVFNCWRDIFSFGNLSEIVAEPDDVTEAIESFLALVQKAGKRAIVTTFDTPQIRVAIRNGNRELAATISELNSRLFSLDQSHACCSVMPLQQVVQNSEITWNNSRSWYSFGQPMTAEASILSARSIASHICAGILPSKKLLVLDLDNTLWGGVIGDDGPDGILLGQETAEGRIFSDIQAYFKMLKESGVLLAVVSKNESHLALEGLEHSNGILKPQDFVAIRTNWEQKSKNIAEIARDLNLGLQSVVFVDDSPTERAEVMQSLPDVTVPDVGSAPEGYLRILSDLDYFAIASPVTSEDSRRTTMYVENAHRDAHQISFANEEDFLKSLNVRVRVFNPDESELARVHQLTNKTNQFNLTTLRLEIEQVELYSTSDRKQILAVQVADRFGDYGLVSACYINQIDTDWVIDNWVMSCRIFSKTVEDAVAATLFEIAENSGIRRISAKYAPTKKNKVVSGLLERLGFRNLTSDSSGASEWLYNVGSASRIKPTHVCEVTNEF